MNGLGRQCLHRLSAPSPSEWGRLWPPGCSKPAYSSGEDAPGFRGGWVLQQDLIRPLELTVLRLELLDHHASSVVVPGRRRASMPAACTIRATCPAPPRPGDRPGPPPRSMTTPGSCFARLSDKPLSTLLQPAGILPRCWNKSTLSWVQTLHQTRGGSVSLSATSPPSPQRLASDIAGTRPPHDTRLGSSKPAVTP